METIYLAGGCLWGVQAFVRTLPGVVATEAGRANGTSAALCGEYDGHLFEIIDPYSVDRQGDDVGPRYRTGIYSTDPGHLAEARAVIDARPDRDRIAVEVAPLTRYVRSADEHQDRLERCPDDYCHIPAEVLTRYA